MASSKHKGCIIFLNGRPGTGKLTIAKAVKAKLQHTDTRLLDNHLFIDIGDCIHPDRGENYRALRERLRDTALNDLRRSSNKDTIIIFTGCQSNNEPDQAVFAKHVALARDLSIPFYWFTVTVEQDEHRRRLQSPSRTEDGKRKLVDWDQLQNFMKEIIMLDPSNEKLDEESNSGVERFHKVIDTSGLSMEASATEIIDYVKQMRSPESSVRPTTEV